MKITKEKMTAENILKLTLKSTNAKNGEVYIFEIDSLEKFLPKDKYKKELQEARREFIKNKINIFQITNHFSEEKFLPKVEKDINRIINYRYISKNSFSIENEILIFDDTVAIYNEKEITIIKDRVFAKNQKQAFLHIWGNSFLPKKGFSEEKNFAVYNSCDVFPKIDNEKVFTIVWPDADTGLAWENSKYKLEKNIEKIYQKDKDFFKNASYVVAITWALEEEVEVETNSKKEKKKVFHKMIDLWKFIDNYVDDRSGPIGDVRVYKNGIYQKDLEVASGSSLLILGYEEKLRRQSVGLHSYLNFSSSQPNQARPPFGICNNKDFFKD